MEPLIDNPPVRLRTCRHGPMMYLTNDLIGRSLDTYGEFSEHELALFGDVVQPGMTVLDVGSNIGTHAVFFARGLRVYQATVMGPHVDADTVETFFGSLKIAP